MFHTQRVDLLYVRGDISIHISRSAHVWYSSPLALQRTKHAVRGIAYLTSHKLRVEICNPPTHHRHLSENIGGEGCSHCACARCFDIVMTHVLQSPLPLFIRRSGPVHSCWREMGLSDITTSSQGMHKWAGGKEKGGRESQGEEEGGTAEGDGAARVSVGIIVGYGGGRLFLIVWRFAVVQVIFIWRIKSGQVDEAAGPVLLTWRHRRLPTIPWRYFQIFQYSIWKGVINMVPEGTRWPQRPCDWLQSLIENKTILSVSKTYVC